MQRPLRQLSLGPPIGQIMVRGEVWQRRGGCEFWSILASIFRAARGVQRLGIGVIGDLHPQPAVRTGLRGVYDDPAEAQRALQRRGSSGDWCSHKPNDLARRAFRACAANAGVQIAAQLQ